MSFIVTFSTHALRYILLLLPSPTTLITSPCLSSVDTNILSSLRSQGAALSPFQRQLSHKLISFSIYVHVYETANPIKY